MHSLWLISAWCFLFSGLLRVFASRRDAALAATICFGLIVLLITEILSAGTMFYFQPLLSVWIGAAALSAVFRVVICRLKPEPPRTRLSSADPIVPVCAICIAVILGIIGLTAVLSPPNNWDAMTYHMARVANWVQNRTVAFYPTPILRQLYLGPLAEYAIANLQILTGSDRLANLVQFTAMIGNVLGVTAIAAKLGAAARGQAISGLFAATIPMLILQASNTQTDCVAALWVVCTINLGLNLIRPTPALRYSEKADPSRNKLHQVTDTLFFAISLGLAFLTKATTAFVLAPLVVWILIARVKTTGPISTVKLLAITCTLPLLINALQFCRNHSAFGRFLTPDAEAGWYQNSIHTPGAIVSSLARNILSNTGFRGMHSYPVHANTVLKTISGLDPSDPRITYSGQKFLVKYTRDEHDAGNPIHLAIGAICIAIAIWNFRRNRPAAIYACCILCGLFIFSYELKWQPWITRLQLPIFVILAPLCGLLVDSLRQRSVAILLCAVLFAQSLIYLVYGFPRPLRGTRNIFSTPRANLYFNKRPDLQQPYQQAARLIVSSHPTAVAITSKGDSWEYAIRSQLPPGTAIVHVGVENQSEACRSFAPDHHPEFLVQLEDAKIPADYSAYEEIYKATGIAVWWSSHHTH